jgi:hypothetical protein
MPVLAAQVLMEIVDIKVMLGRTDDIPRLCERMIEVFESAELPAEAMKALAYLHTVAAKRRVTDVDVNELRAFFDRIEASPATQFIPQTM